MACGTIFMHFPHAIIFYLFPKSLNIEYQLVKRLQTSVKSLLMLTVPTVIFVHSKQKKQQTICICFAHVNSARTTVYG